MLSKAKKFAGQTCTSRALSAQETDAGVDRRIGGGSGIILLAHPHGTRTSMKKGIMIVAFTDFIKQ